MTFDYKCGPHCRRAITILRVTILLPPEHSDASRIITQMWRSPNYNMDDSKFAPGNDGSACSSAEHHNRGDWQYSHLLTNLPTRGLYSTFSKCNWNTLTYSPDFFWSTISTRQCNAAGVRCIRKLGWWSWNRWASPTWAQGRPQGDYPLCLCSVSG